MEYPSHNCARAPSESLDNSRVMLPPLLSLSGAIECLQNEEALISFQQAAWWQSQRRGPLGSEGVRLHLSGRSVQ